MQTKEITKMLGIPRERIKYYRRKMVFMPEHTGEPGKTGEYSERDIQNLKRLEVLTKAGLTCDDIRKIQTGSLSLEEAFSERRKTLQDDIAKKQGALTLSAKLMENCVEFSSAGLYWEDVHQRELAGERFEEPWEEYQTIALDRTVKCPSCGGYIDIDFEDYEIDTTVNPSSRDDDMGDDVVHTFDTEDALKCVHCGRSLRVKGWVREYPAGAYDSESISVTFEESEETAND